METPDNKAGELTEKIMIAFNEFNENVIIKVDVSTYNRIYSHVYSVLQKEFKLNQSDYERLK